MAGAAILAGASASAVGRSDQNDEVAFAQPRISSSMPGGAVALPNPLSAADAVRIRRIFALQAEGNHAVAAQKMRRLGDPLLHGHLLADRFLDPAALLDAAMLRDWLERYADLPDAPAIRALLNAQADATQPSTVPAGPSPSSVATAAAAAAAPATASQGIEDLDPVERIVSRNPLLDRTVRERARAGRPEWALRLLAATKGLGILYEAQLRAEIAQALFTQGRDKEAIALAEGAHRQANGELGLPPYVAGLAAWRLGRFDLAAPLFGAAAQAPLATPALRSGAAYWAARVHLRQRDAAGARPWLRQAALHRRTFYGLLARRALGRTLPVQYGSPAVLGEADVDAVAATPQGQRAFGLLQVGQPRRAEAELTALWAGLAEHPAMARSVLLVAQEAGLVGLAGRTRLPAQAVDDVADLPMPALRPTGGFRIDPALVYALARLESNFDTAAVSPAGARGLMQIMPTTASYIAGDGKMDGLALRLHDPATNLDVGQRYILHLATLDIVGGDLIRLLASYNAGPGSFGKWSGGIRHDGDPLLFIESIPNDETRAYVPRALAWTWLYAGQLRRPAPSLDDLLAGVWPRFQGPLAVPAGSTKGAAANAAIPLVARLH